MRTLCISLAIALIQSWVFLSEAGAIPAFAHQTGQSCIACHAGGQFPELNPYGRLFKLMGYTMGESTNPFAVMVVGSWTKTQKNTTASGAELSPKDRQAIIDYASFFAGGKITENLGVFSQFNYESNDPETGLGYFSSDNFDLRYADRKVSPSRDSIWGLTLNNNPSVQDVWNSSPAWSYPYTSSTQGAFSELPVSTLLEGALSHQVAGLGGYLYYNQNYYLELTGYGTAQGPFSILSVGRKRGDVTYPLTFLNGIAPYLRLAYSREFGPHNYMIGAFGMETELLPLDNSNQPLSGQGTVRYRDRGLDAQYQYLMDIHTITAHFRLIHETISDSTVSNASKYAGEAGLDSLHLKLCYIYQAQYGFSLAYASITGNRDPVYTGSANSSPNSRQWTPEIFWLVRQNIRAGLQYGYFSHYLGAGTNYDGNGRDASDNNTTYAYLWAVF